MTRKHRVVMASILALVAVGFSWVAGGQVIKYRLKHDAHVSLAVYDAEGRMVRELARATPQAAGRHEAAWDGLDRQGRPVPPGKYTWKLLESEGLETEYLMTLGTSMGINPWPGVHGGPSAVTVVGDSLVMAGAGSETASGLARSKLDGTFEWAAESLNGWDAGTDMAVVGDKLWVQYAGDGSTRAADAATGAFLKEAMVHRVPMVALALKDTAPSAYAPATGHGWRAEDLDKVAAEVGSGHRIKGPPSQSNADKAVHFLVDLPKIVMYPGTTYFLRLKLAGAATGPASDTTHVMVQGKWAGSWNRKTEAAGKVFESSVGEVDGRMDIGFYATDGALDAVVERIEIAACANRMAADERQMVVAAAGASSLYWVCPPTRYFWNDPRPYLFVFAGLTGDFLPGYAELRFPRCGMTESPMTDRAGLLSPVPGSSDRIARVAYINGGWFDFDLNLKDGQAHRVALYLAGPKERQLKVQVLGADGKTVLDSREARDNEDGRYLVWNLRGHVILRVTALAGAPVINALFFDPPEGGLADGVQAAFVRDDTTTHGDWKGVYGRDGRMIAGDTSAVLDTAEVPGIQDVAIQPDGSLVAISGDSLVTLSRQAKTPVVRVKGLESPAFLAVDKSNGDILVAQAGKSSQVVRFDRAFNKGATYGRAGGRRQGRYIPEDFAGLSNVASDNRGGFLVAEWLAAPRRLAHFDRNGKLLREWLGGQMFYHSLGLNPANPGQVLHNSQFGTLVEYAVDYDRRTSKVVATWDINSQLDPVLFPRNNGFQVWMHPLTISNQTYYASELATGLILKPDYENGRLIPVAAVCSAPQIEKAPTNHPWRVAAEAFSKADGKGWGLHAYRGFGYADLNGDERMQPEEFNLMADAGPWGTGYHDGGAGSVLGPDGTVWRWGSGIGQPAWHRVAASGFTAKGVPIWEIAKRENGPKRPGEGTTHLWPGDAGRLYTLEYLDGDNFAAWWTQTYWEGHGFGWPATMLNGSALRCRDATGNLLWQTSGHHSGGPDSPRGNVDMPWRIAGVIGDVIGLTSQTRQPCEFFATDGLYIGSLFDRRAADGLPDSVYAWWRADQSKGDSAGNTALLNYDMGGSGRLARRANGDILFFGAGWNNIPVFRVNGWDQVGRQQGTVRLKRPAQAAAGTGTGLRAEYFASTNLVGEPAVRRVDADVWFGYANKAKANGSRIPWPEPEITGKPFSVRWTGFIEPRFSEETTLAFYARNSGVRLWLGEQLVIDQWDGGEKKAFGKPALLEAGKKMPIRIEWRQLKPAPEAHLCWESLSQPIEHVPAGCLYAH